MFKKLVITTFIVAVVGMLIGVPEISHAASGKEMSTQISARKGPSGGPGPGRPGGPGPGRPGRPGPGRPGGPGPGRPGGPGPGRPGGPFPPPPYVEHHYHHDHDAAVAVGGAMFLLGALMANGN